MWLLQVPSIFLMRFVFVSSSWVVPANQALQYFSSEVAGNIVKGNCIYQFYLC